MSVLTREPIKTPRVKIANTIFAVKAETKNRDINTDELLYETVLEQVGHSHKRPSKKIFQYTDIIEIPL